MVEQNTSNILIQVRVLDKNYIYIISSYSSTVEQNTVNIRIDVRFILRAYNKYKFIFIYFRSFILKSFIATI